MNIYYQNSNGQQIQLVSERYRMLTTDLFVKKWSYDSVSNLGNNRIAQFYKSISTKKVKFTVFGNTKQECYSLVNSFNDLTELDIKRNCLGRLYYGDYYLNCNIFGSEPSKWEYGVNFIDLEIELIVPNPTWIKEIKLDIESSAGVSDLTELDFPFDFPFDFPMSKMVNKYIDNPSYESVNFRMEIYGQASHPLVQIGDSIYSLYYALNEGEYAVIDSLKGTITRHLINGTEENIFHWRENTNSIFTKIPSGQSLVITDFRTVITIYIERSEPEWTV